MPDLSACHASVWTTETLPLNSAATAARPHIKALTALFGDLFEPGLDCGRASRPARQFGAQRVPFFDQ
jgi:hypothetical protein